MDLFETVRDKLGCEYISDMRSCRALLTDAKKVVASLDLEAYTARELADMAEYLYGKKMYGAEKLISKSDGVPTTEIVTRSPKSATARRIIPLFPQVWNDLMTYHGKQQEMLCKQGLQLTSSTPVFSTPAGIVYEPRTYEDLFKRTLKAADLPNINFHALRHTFATRALEASMDIKVLSSILGHAQASTTLNLYAHALPNHKRQSMEKMGSFYSTECSA